MRIEICHQRILLLCLTLLGLQGLAWAQQPIAQGTQSFVANQYLAGPPPACTDPALECIAPSITRDFVPSPPGDQFGTPPGSCGTCNSCELDPANCPLPFGTCVNSNWSSLPGGAGATVRPLRIRKFAPPPGVCADLLQAELTFRGEACGLLRVELRDPLNACTATMQLTLGFLLEADPLLPPSEGDRRIVDEFFSFNVPLQAFDGTIDFQGPSGAIRVIDPVTREKCFRIIDPALLALLVDTTPLDPSDDFYEFDHTATATSARFPCAPVTFVSDPFMGVEVDVRYRYCENQPPVVGNDSATVCRNGSVDIPVTANDSDPEGLLDCASVTVTSQPANGTATVVGCVGIGPNCPGCVIRYVPNMGYVGPDSFTYSIADQAGCSSPGNVSVTVCATDAADDQGFRVCRGSQISIPVTANDTTTCGTINCATLTIVTLPQHGTAVVNGCNILYVPTDPSFTGVDTFTYSVGNSQNPSCTDTATVSVEVCAVDAQDDTGIFVCRGGQVSIPVTANDATSCGTLNCATLTIDPRPAVGSAVVQGCSIVYTAPAAFTGNVTFGYRISNSEGCSDTATVSLTVCGANANDDTSILLCYLTSIDIPILNNDTSTCGTLSCAGVTVISQPAHGTAVVVPGNPCIIRYTHTNAAHNGPDSFVYQVTDSVGCSDTGTVSLTVCRTTAGDDTARTCVGQAVSVPVRVNDSTTCGGLTNASIMVVSGPSNGQAVPNGPNIVYTPNPGFVGQDSFVYTIASNQAPFCADTATVTIDVCAVNANNDTNIRLCQLGSLAIPVTNNDSSTCGTLDCSTLMVVTQPAHGTATVQGCTILYTHTNPNHSGPDSFTYSIGDSVGCSDTATVSLEVCLTVAQDDQAEVCNGQSVTIPVRNNDATTCGALNCDSITVLTQPAHGTVTRRGCNLIYTSTNPEFAGVDCFTYSIASNQAPFCVDTAQVCVDVCRTIAQDDLGLRVCAGESISVPVTANDSSTCGPINCASLTIVTQPAQGTAVVNGCNIVYTAPPGFAGLVEFTYRVANSGRPACTDIGRVAIEVCRTQAQDDLGLRVCRGSSVSIPVTANDSTTCGRIDCASLMIVSPPAHGTAVVNGCNIVYTATDLAFAGTDSFTYKVANGGSPACFDEGRVEVQVCATIAGDDEALVCTGESVCTPVTVNDSTTCGSLNCASITILSGPANGTAQVQGCTICYTANQGFVGFDSLVYRIANGEGCTDTATLRIEVKPEPIARDDDALLPEPPAPIVVPVLDNDSAGAGCVLLPGTVTIVSQGAHGTATPNPDGTVTYVPDASFPDNGSDVFCYEVQNDCGCRDTACVTVRRMSCPMVNRRMPGSLLVFPEFDNRQANQTLITITNTNCDPMSGPVRVEVIYIRDTDCLEANYTITLTPCDTWTAMTSFHNPNFSRGYVYAFAKDSQNRAISFNWLIGHQMITDGIDVLEHGVNPVVFKAIPPAYQLTDADNDRVRDLDDVEYQMAPDELLVPRFLGQGGDFDSKLVLLNLSGGKQFTAVVDFLIYNDNEEVFSAQRSFRCWKKWRLVEISGAFDNDFLKSTKHDPAEIIGQEERESGWFRINGNSASSTQEFIVDPALLGYMIERAGEWTAAALPWEVCAQENGDLLPLGLFGDPRPGFPNGQLGDNQ